MSKEITFYGFYSGVRSFLSMLIKDPINAHLSDRLKDSGVDKKKLINDLISRGVISRSEKIRDQFNSDEKTPKYVVKYKVKKKDFDKKMHRLYSKYFEKDNINECDCGSVGGSLDGSGTFLDGGGSYGSNGGSTTTFGTGTYEYTKPLSAKKKKSKKNESDVMRRNIYLTESQMNYINEFFNTPNNGDSMLDEDFGGATSTTNVIEPTNTDTTWRNAGLQIGKNDPSLKRPKVKGLRKFKNALG